MKKKLDLKKYSKFFFLLFSISLVIIGRTSLADVVSYPFSYVFSPVYVLGNSVGSHVSEWQNALTNASSYIQEFNEMKEEIAKLKIENSERILDYEEYLSLKESSALLATDSKYVEAKIINVSSDGEITINCGTNEGVRERDVVSLGRVFIGTISDVGLYSSSVRLPTNKSSTYEVVIVSSTVDLNKDNRVDSLIKSSGVIIGGHENIIIENMGINSSVEDGDIVLIRDKRVGDVLIVGSLIGVSKNPASTSKTGYVSPIFDYSNILTVFVKENATD